MVGAGLFTAAIVPMVRQFGLKWGLIDQPDPRKQHLEPMGRLGGIGIVLGFCLALLITWLLGGFVKYPSVWFRIKAASQLPCPLLLPGPQTRKTPNISSWSAGSILAFMGPCSLL